MSGIVGLATERFLFNRSILTTMRDAMRHRGPNSGGDWWSADGRVGFGHRRLAIIDVSEQAQQPMMDHMGTLVITFNGAIYNHMDLRRELRGRGHKFRTHSDTEVILEAYKAWGKQCVTRLNGMFAFGIYDQKEQTLFLARDRAGEKPLFYTHQQGIFAFASELKALIANTAFPRHIDLTALNFYFSYGFVPGAHCIFREMHKLPPGHALSFNAANHTFELWPYWELPQAQTGRKRIEQYSDALEEILEDAVRRQMIADVPVGIMLSGGLDSSIITALAARATYKTVKTFTAVFPGYEGHDESAYARRVAAHFGTEHTELVMEPTVVGFLPELARQFDEPMADSSMVTMYFIARLISDNARVALCGDGGDELFGGYSTYRAILYHGMVRKYMPSPVRRAISGMTRRFVPHGTRGRNFFLGLRAELGYALSQNGLLFDAHFIEQMVVPLRHNRADIHRYKSALGEPARGLPGMAMAVDFKMYLPDDILVKVDRTSMLNALEVRVPLLDYRVIEFAFGTVPNHLRVHKQGKILLKHLAGRILPDDLDLNHKKGFRLPLNDWFKGQYGDFVSDVLANADPHIFNKKEIERLVRDQNKGYFNTERLFAVVLFELWQREYKAVIV